MLGAPGPVPSASLTEQFNEALCAVAFDKGNIAREQGVVSWRKQHCCNTINLAAITAVVSSRSSPCALHLLQAANPHSWLISCSCRSIN